MTDSLDELHAQAFLGPLIANPALGAAKVFDGKVPDPTPFPPYALAYVRVAWPRDGLGTSLDAVQRTITATATVHCVGLNAAAARVVQMQVRSSLLNVRPVIAGRNCSPIKQDESMEPDRDESTGKLVMDSINVFSFTSTG